MSSMSDSDDDDYDSDDEYLTNSNPSAGGGGNRDQGGGNNDREAIIRKKLLESFYGKTTKNDTPTKKKQASQHGSTSSKAKEELGRRGKDNNNNYDENRGDKHINRNPSEEDVDDDDDDYGTPTRDQVQVGSVNLDSTNFVAKQFVDIEIGSSSFESLLIKTEKLASDIRGLESTTQTLVYENYSKFIDATDAIRSIGRSVGASDSGLQRLATSIQKVERETSSVDSALAEYRTAVVDKVRIKRHLDRLDALLKLPQTLQSYISNLHYRKASKSFVCALPILSKHSGSFESLAQIESECNKIISEMTNDLEIKLSSWTTGSSTKQSIKPTATALTSETSSPRNSSSFAPLSSKQISEVFECAGALQFLSTAETTKTASGNDNSSMMFDRMALTACSIMLCQSLEWPGMGTGAGAIIPMHRETKSSLSDNNKELSAAKVLKQRTERFLQTIFDTAVMFGSVFPPSSTSSDSSTRYYGLLSSFIGQTFPRLLHFVRSVADKKFQELALPAEESSSSGGGDVEAANIEASRTARKKAEGLPTFKKSTSVGSHCDEIIVDLLSLTKSVREMASKLTLPEIGLDVELAGTMVDQTVEMTEGLLQSYVQSHFQRLRSKIVSNCVVPYMVQASKCSDLESIASAADDLNNNDEEDRSIRNNNNNNNVFILGQTLMNDVADAAEHVVSNVLSNFGTSSRERSAVEQFLRDENKHFTCWFLSLLTCVAGDIDCSSEASLRVPKKKDDHQHHHGSDDVDTAIYHGNVMNKLCKTPVTELETAKILSVLKRFEDVRSNSETNNSSNSAVTAVGCPFALCVGVAVREARYKFSGGMIQSLSSMISSNSDHADQDAIDQKMIDEQFHHVANNCFRTFLVNMANDITSRVTNMPRETTTSTYDETTGEEVATTITKSCFVDILRTEKHLCDNLGRIYNFSTNFPLVFVEPFHGSGGAMGFQQPYGGISGANVMGGGGFGGTSSTTPNLSSGLKMDVERMFAEKIPIHFFLDVDDLTQEKVACGYRRIVIRGLLEHSRMLFFDSSSVAAAGGSGSSSASLLQMQMDVKLARMLSPHLIRHEAAEAGTMDCLMDELLSSCVRRCVTLEPPPMEDEMFGSEWWDTNLVELNDFIESDSR